MAGSIHHSYETVKNTLEKDPPGVKSTIISKVRLQRALLQQADRAQQVAVRDMLIVERFHRF